MANCQPAADRALLACRRGAWSNEDALLTRSCLQGMSETPQQSQDRARLSAICEFRLSSLVNARPRRQSRTRVEPSEYRQRRLDLCKSRPLVFSLTFL